LGCEATGCSDRASRQDRDGSAKENDLVLPIVVFRTVRCFSG
jgi:hypothetical protein